ncbi:hypothetical protein JAAARDRAFT_360875 [Jaapia argillacea MUCL 33604]|uniref:Poly(A) RNA polymerase mitochondrial-like central palm domain-containing protein n=1 Tax=Jaapia argillacea MUCL 33604 TaxID=933084 RepID=A0A067Q7F5_9AGAM|nr:hypothetical protein JAAARDRAFT_360875 [Jaapia argillacea MUCL 33604]
MTMHSRGQNSTSSGPSKPYPDFIPLSQPSSGIGASGSRSQGQRKNEKKRKHPASPAVGGDDDPMHTPWLDSLGMTEYESKEQRLHDEIVAYVAYIAPTQAETSARHFVITHLHEVIKRRFRDAALRMFGSVVHQVCLPDGDIDLVLETVHVVDTKEDQKRALFQLRNRIRDAQLANDIQVVGQARVPIINLKTTPQYGSFDVDISINNTDGVHAIDIISSYMTSIPALRPLLFTLKGFLSQRQLNSAASSTLSSYCLICMVISFLQVRFSIYRLYVTFPL